MAFSRAGGSRTARNVEVNVLSDEYYSNDEEDDEDTEESDDEDFHPFLSHQENSDTSLNHFTFSSSSSSSEDEGGSHHDVDAGEVEKDCPFFERNRDAGAEGELLGHVVRGKNSDSENRNLNSCKLAVIGRSNNGSNSLVKSSNSSEGRSQRILPKVAVENRKGISLGGNQQKQTIPYGGNEEGVCQQQYPVGKSRTEHPPSAYAVPLGNESTACPEIGVDSIDDNGLDSPIWKRTRAHVSLEDLSLDDLEAFLDHSDEEDFFQQIDEEAEYRKFVAAVMAPQTQDSSIQHDGTNDGIVYIGDEEDEEDENFPADDETLVTNPQPEVQYDLQKQSTADTEQNKQINEPNTRQPKRQRTVPEAEAFRPPPRPVLPTLLPHPVVPPLKLNTDSASQYMPLIGSLSFFPVAAPQHIGFSRCQIGQLFALIYEHVQLLIQIHALSALEPSLTSVAELTQTLLTDLTEAWKSTAVKSIRVLASDCFSFPDPVAMSSPPALESFTATLVRPFYDSSQMPISPFFDSWNPEMDFSTVRSAIDVPPLLLVEDYVTDMSIAAQKEKEMLGKYTLPRSAPIPERVPLFDNCSLPSETISDTSEKQSEPKDGNARKGYGKKHRNEKKRLTDVGIFSRAGKDATLPLVALSAAQAIARFRPLFNPALFPLKTSTEGIKRVLFTETEDRLLAMGVHLFNNDWEAIRTRFLPAKTSQQVAIRYKNCCSGRHPANPVKAVRNLKMTPLSIQEQMIINEALKVRRMDWPQVWRYCVPYRDPGQLPRQWREASGLPLQSRNAANAQRRRLQRKEQASEQKDQIQTNESFGSLGGDSGLGQSIGVVPADSGEDRAAVEGDHLRPGFFSSSTFPSKTPVSQPVAAPTTSQPLSGLAGQDRHGVSRGSLVNHGASGASIEVVGTGSREAEHLVPDTTLRREQEAFSPAPVIDSPIAFSENRPVQEQSPANVGAHISYRTASQQQGTISRRRRYRKSRLRLNPSLPPIILPNGRVIHLSKKSPHNSTQHSATFGIDGRSTMSNIGTQHSTEQATATPCIAVDRPPCEASQNSLTQENVVKKPPTGVGVSSGVSFGSIGSVHPGDLQQNQVRSTGNGSSKAWDSQPQSHHYGDDSISQQEVDAGRERNGSSSPSQSASDTDSLNEQEDTRRWPWGDNGNEVIFDCANPLLFGLPQTRQEDQRRRQLAPGMTRPIAEKAVTPSARRMLLELVGYDPATVSQMQNDTSLYSYMNNNNNANAEEATANNSWGDGEQRVGAACEVNQAGLRVQERGGESTLMARPGRAQNDVPAGEAAGSIEIYQGQDSSRGRGLDIDLNELCEPGSEDENFDIVVQHYENRQMTTGKVSTEKDRNGKTDSGEAVTGLEHSLRVRENDVYASVVEAPAELQPHPEMFRDQSHTETVPSMAKERAGGNEENPRRSYSGLETLCIGCEIIEFECEEMSDSEEEEDEASYM